MKKPILLKVITCGDGGVGKTTLLHRYIEGVFLADTRLTIGVEFFLKELKIEGKKILLQVWDFGGQDHFRPLLKNYAVGARGALLLFDLTRPSSLENIEQWVKICREDNPNIPIIFVGTKLDLIESNSIDDAFTKDFMDTYDLFTYLRISSKTGENVNQTFKSLAKAVIRNLD
jgi:small GTP-binding protein